MRTTDWISYFLFTILTGSSLIVVGLSSTSGENREARKLFGGYRITPKFCKASKTLPPGDHRSHGPTICMFNHECTQRNGEVVGACMDGFLFGTCCQLPGSVMTPLSSTSDNFVSQSSSRPAAALSYEAYGQQSGGDYFSGLYGDDVATKERPSSGTLGGSQVTYTTSSGYYDNSAIDIDSKINVGNPSNNILTYTNGPSSISNGLLSNGAVVISSPSSVNDYEDDKSSSYFPSSTTQSSTKGGLYPSTNKDYVQTFSGELPTLISHYSSTSNDLSVSTEPNKDFTAAGISHITNTLLNQHRPDFSQSGILHHGPDSDLIESDEKEINIYSTPSFSTASFSTTDRNDDTTTPRVVKVTYNKPQFKPKPKPTKSSLNNADKYVLVHTISNEKDNDVPTKPDATISDNDIESIESIILMLNDTKNRPHYSTGADTETTSYNSATPSYGTRRPIHSTNEYAQSNVYITTKLPSSSLATKKPSTSYLYSSTPTKRPVTNSYDSGDDKFTLISSTINSIKFPSSTLQPPSTSYLYTSTPTKRPTSDTVIISSSTYGGQVPSSTKKPTTSYVYSSTPITKRPTSYTDEIVITPTTKKTTTTTIIRKTTKRPSISSSTVKYQTKPAKLSTPKPPSTSFVYSTTPTKRPQTHVTVTIQPPKKVTTTYTASTRPASIPIKPIFSPSTYSNDYVTTTDKNQIEYVVHSQTVGQTPVHNVNENGYGTVTFGTDHPVPTVHITPKPTVNLITASTWTQRPAVNKFTVQDKPPSNSYIYSSLPITNRPGAAYYSTTPNYPPLPNNDFDDSGYFGATLRPTVEHTVTQTSVYTVVEKEPINSYGQPISSSSYGDQNVYQSTPSYPAFGGQFSTIKDEIHTSPDDLINFPPVRNPNFNITGNYGGLSEEEISTPSFMEDEALDDKMSILVNKIVASLQGNFDTLADMVYDRNESLIDIQPITTKKPATTQKPTRLTTKRPTNTRPAVTKPSSRPTVTKKPTTDAIKPVRKPSPTTTKKPTKQTTTKRPTTKPTKRVTTVPPPYGGNDEEEEDNDEYVGEENDDDDNNSVSGESRILCGVRPQVKSGRIVGGKASAFGEWPWQVLVRESTWLGLFTKNKCGGVLISNSYVMTAAHCQPGFLASLVAVFGEYDISTELESKRSVTKNVKRVVVHREYDAGTFENDLALLELESPIHYDSHIVPICMPQNEADFTGRMATVTGWGRLKYGGNVPAVLQEVQVPVIENNVCQEMFTQAGHKKIILESFLCAGYANGQKDSCEGDSGGPLVLQRSDGRYELAGTVSHGIKCAAPYLPGVYMRTTFYKPWLQSVTGVH